MGQGHQRLGCSLVGEGSLECHTLLGVGPLETHHLKQQAKVLLAGIKLGVVDHPPGPAVGRALAVEASRHHVLDGLITHPHGIEFGLRHPLTRVKPNLITGVGAKDRAALLGLTIGQVSLSS